MSRHSLDRWSPTPDGSQHSRGKKRVAYAPQTEPTMTRSDDYQHDDLSVTELADLLGIDASALTITMPEPQEECAGSDAPRQAIQLGGLEPDDFQADFGTGLVGGVLRSTDDPATTKQDTNTTENQDALLLTADPFEEHDAASAIDIPDYSVDSWDADLTLPEAEPSNLPWVSEFDIPEIGGAGDPDEEADFTPDVNEELRARQLASQFLRQIDEHCIQNIDWITEIILARRWGSAQRKVAELWQAGFSIRAIFMAFQVSESWRQCDCLDQQFSEWLRYNPYLTWLEAIQLVEHHDESASLEDIMAFVDLERHIWRQSRHLVRNYPSFKNYLLSHRITKECKRPDLGWVRNLSPSDERRFDGSTNPEYTADCWEDEAPACSGSQHLNRRIYMGEHLSYLFLDQESNSDWNEG